MNGYLADLFELKGRTVLVTGGSKGIGRELSRALASAGARVIVASRSDADVRETVSDIQWSGGSAHPAPLDVTNAASISHAFDAVVREFGRLDVLVNCAGRVSVQDAHQMTEIEWDAVVDTNLKGAFLCCREAGKIMIAQGRGKIVNIASALGLTGLEGRSAYCASKGGLINLTRALAVEWAPYTINVNAIAPTTTLTGQTAHQYPASGAIEKKLQEIPLGRFGTPEDLVGAVIYLAGPASDFVTGHVLVVDGGYTAR
jgi:NAD(P)-dependent dehydrogenase (short-subunit alcohol dehydrogenase family)